MPSRMTGRPVLVAVGNGGFHRGAWYRDGWGSILACDDCDVVTKRSRRDDSAIERSFRLHHTKAAKLPPYQPRHLAQPDKEHA